MADKADHLVTVSHAVRNYMQEVDHIGAEIDVVYLGFNFDRFSPNEADRQKVRSEFGFKESEIVIGFVANLTPGKGHVQLIQAFAEIAKQVPQARLFFVGSGQLDEIVRTVNLLQLAEKIVFAGWRSDIPACLNAMDIFVQPSFSEAFSQVLIEAMAVGLPVIATNVGGAREVITENQEGILIEPNSPESITVNVLKLLEHPQFRKRMAKQACESVRARFTAEHMVENQFALYRKWLGED
jgi:glycosyltransferase involved in cell wall biosynthesis